MINFYSLFLVLILLRLSVIQANIRDVFTIVEVGLNNISVIRLPYCKIC